MNTNDRTFKQRFLNGECPMSAIDDYIETWHNMSGNEEVTLQDFLGLTDEEYYIMAVNGNDNLEAHLMQQRKIKVVILEPAQPARIAEIEASLESYQSIVGGYIETVHPLGDGDVILVCNEEGKIFNLPPNRLLCDDRGKAVDIIQGTAFICGVKGESFCSLTDKKAETYAKIYRLPIPAAEFRSESEKASRKPPTADWNR